MVQAVDKPGRAAKFVYIKEAVGRWAREVWLLASTIRPLDALSAQEVVTAAGLVQAALDNNSEMINGPLWAITVAFRQLG